jgi:putative ABC transport system substrate-binding protein
MRRREFIAGLGGTAVWPFTARAQQSGSATIGFLFSGKREAVQMTAFHKGLSELGFVEGRNLAVEYRFADDDYERLPALTLDLVRRGGAAIFATGARLQSWRPKLQRRRYPSSFWPATIRSRWVSSQPSTGRKATSPASFS